MILLAVFLQNVKKKVEYVLFSLIKQHFFRNLSAFHSQNSDYCL